MRISDLNNIDFHNNLDGTLEVKLTIEDNEVNRFAIENVLMMYYNDVPLRAAIWPQKREKSIQANNYAWHLICQMAEVLGSTKEEIYRQLVSDYGTCTVHTVLIDDLETFVRDWHQAGLGYVVEIIDSDAEAEIINVLCYRGIHSYTKHQMAIFLNGVVYEARELGLEVRTKKEIEQMIQNWNPKTPFSKSTMDEIRNIVNKDERDQNRT